MFFENFSVTLFMGRWPGFGQPRYIRTARSFPVTPFLAAGPAIFIAMLHTCLEVVPCNLTFNEPLEGVDSFDVLLDMNESNINESGFYPGFQRRFVVLYSIEIRIFLFKIDMLTCRSVQVRRTFRRSRLIRCSFRQERF